MVLRGECECLEIKNEHTLLFRKLDNEDKYLYKCQMEIVTSLRTNIFHCIAENS